MEQNTSFSTLFIQGGRDDGVFQSTLVDSRIALLIGRVILSGVTDTKVSTSLLDCSWISCVHVQSQSHSPQQFLLGFEFIKRLRNKICQNRLIRAQGKGCQ